jgi:UDP-N-acetylmuramoyl-L-alanyl-D-glutamate--2,6-diaminopimelate ligase
MTLEELLPLVKAGETRVRLDSRLVGSGDVFVAVAGTSVDGHDFAAEACAKGAGYVVCERPLACPGAEAVVVGDSAVAAARLAQAAAGCPAARLTNLAVTGTNGKTTVAFLARRCLAAAGRPCGMIGTVSYHSGRPAYLTTPDPLVIAAEQAAMVEAGLAYMVIEASSHGLWQNRLACIDFKAAAFTNLGREHLDYHKDRRAYLDAKSRLFEGLSAGSAAVLNADSAESAEIAERTRAGVIWYGIDGDSAKAAPSRKRDRLAARVESMDIDGTSFLMEYAGSSHRVRNRLLGLHNVSNCLAAAGLVIAAGVEPSVAAAGLSEAPVVPGRLERLDGDGFCVFIDYAHTDDALSCALSTLRPLCAGVLTVVFGCGGDRDRSKRPLMGRVAEKLADRVIITSDNPRTERPEAIIAQITAGLANPDSPKIAVEPDRKRAIELALEKAAAGDVVLVAGKGHEDYQVIGTERISFSDRDVAARCLGG